MAEPFVCESCGTHLPTGRDACPHCDGKRFVSARKSAFAAALLLGLAACGGDDGDSDMQALYGEPVMDNDGDGFDNTVDCNDGDATINPDATEVTGDDVDSNCDGDPNT